jgi:D-glycero-D-manno-heptose 1,7-bisphosphate phosphatase
MQLAKALFLDRDGVVNRDTGYVHRIEDFVFVPPIFDLARRARGAGFRLVVVTNQAGIARGLYTEAQFMALTEWMKGRFAAEGAPLDAVYHCPYHPTAGIGRYRRDHAWRKPRPGMILEAERRLKLDLPGSILIGDRETDIEAARNAGVGTAVLLAPAPPAETRADRVEPDLAAAYAWFRRAVAP